MQKVEESGMSKAKFAELVGIARQNVEKTVFSKHSLDTDLLCRISEVLDCNFFDYYRSDTECNTKDYTMPVNLRAVLTILTDKQCEQIKDFVKTAKTVSNDEYKNKYYSTKPNQT